MKLPCVKLKKTNGPGQFSPYVRDAFHRLNPLESEQGPSGSEGRGTMPRCHHLSDYAKEPEARSRM